MKKYRKKKYGKYKRNYSRTAKIFGVPVGTVLLTVAGWFVVNKLKSQ